VETGVAGRVAFVLRPRFSRRVLEHVLDGPDHVRHIVAREPDVLDHLAPLHRGAPGGTRVMDFGRVHRVRCVGTPESWIGAQTTGEGFRESPMSNES